MKLLLDTHSLIWFFAGHPNLSDTVRQLMENPNYQKLISLATVWEMGIKLSKGKLFLSVPLENYITEKTRFEDFNLLPIELNHLALISTLPFYHSDPFDRLLIAQAMTEKIPLLSKDVALDSYPIRRIWQGTLVNFSLA